MEKTIWGIFGTLITAAILALASLYVQVQVMEAELAHMQQTIESLQRYIMGRT